MLSDNRDKFEMNKQRKQIFIQTSFHENGSLLFVLWQRNGMAIADTGKLTQYPNGRCCRNGMNGTVANKEVANGTRMRRSKCYMSFSCWLDLAMFRNNKSLWFIKGSRGINTKFARTGTPSI